MFLLEKDFYSKVEPMFEKILDYETSVKWAFKDNNAPCSLYVDDLITPNLYCLIMNWGFCYFGGKYNERFIESCINHIFSKYGVVTIFADVEFLSEIKEKIPVNYDYWRITRRYYKLNTDQFLCNKLLFKELPENYELILRTEKENEEIILMYNGKKVGHCNAGYNEKITEINFDIFLEEEHRNKGIGPLMCAKLIEYHLLQNHDYITWGCFGNNIPSVKCAEKLGFDLICEDDIIFCLKKSK